MLGFIGVVFMIQGFGSAVAYLFFDSRRFGFLLRWAYDYQPYAGIIVGITGIVIALLGDHLRKSDRKPE